MIPLIKQSYGVCELELLLERFNEDKLKHNI